MNSIDALSKSARVGVNPVAIVLSPLPVHGASSRAPRTPSRDAAGSRACAQAWDRVRGIPPRHWETLARAQEDQDVFPAFSVEDALRGRIPHLAIAHEVRQALEHGVRRHTALACLMLAAIALERHDGGEDAIALAQSALDMAARPGQADAGSVRVLHAALIVARTAGLDRAAAVLVESGRDPALPIAAQLQVLGTAFAAGMQLTDLSHHLDSIRGRKDAGTPGEVHHELSIRADLVRALLCPQAGPALVAPGMQASAGERPGLGYWLARLQVCWYAGDTEGGIAASKRAAESAGPLSSVADILCYRLFSVLTLVRSNASGSEPEVDMHCLALHRLACACPASGAAIAELASAVRERRAGRVLAALRALERACHMAARLGQHWVAALGWEEAALAAAAADLDSAAAHYRQQALASYRHWGALGRVDMLRRQWGETETTPSAEEGAENERLRRAGKLGEMGLSIAHEVNQPLAAIALHSSAARKWLRRAQPNVERALASLDLISDAGRHAGDIVRGIQRLASHNESEIGCVPVDQTIKDALRPLQRLLRKHAIDLVLALDLGKLVIHANRAQFQQVVTNLVVNAIEALSESKQPGPRCIRVESRPAEGGKVEIIVEDNGPGIAPVNRERVFGSLFTTKPENTGLGLSISLAIVRAHQGRIGFEPREPRGARFRVLLPVRGPQA